MNKTLSRTAAHWGALVLAGLLAACGGGSAPAPKANVQNTSTAEPVASAGQVALAATSAKVSFYAASRFAEQVSFGPTPALVAEIQAKGFEKWIDDQFALPVTAIDIKPAEAIYAYGFNDNGGQEITQYLDRQFPHRAIGGIDQLRMRVTWGLSQFVVAAATKGEVPGWVTWHNLLYRNALGRYDTLLREISTDSHMGHYLDNDQNRPKSAECLHCAPNENYARELMQLFSIGVYKLNPDGTAQRDARGRFIETYSQRDVEELARALTGWTRDHSGPQRPPRNWGNWGVPMIPSTWAPDRDNGAKTVMGRTFPAGQGAVKDLDDTVTMLMAHANIAPFVSLRLIQHLVKSNPTPAYVARMAAKFNNNGSGVKGDMKAVVKAILLDAEARAGDSPSTARSDDGKFREPFLYSTAMWRGMGCTAFPSSTWGAGNPAVSGTQRPFAQNSVFSYYAPTDRAPGSNLLAPEQRLATTEELRNRTNQASWPAQWDSTSQKQDVSRLRAAGCDIDGLSAAFFKSPTAYADHLSARYFRGAMPPTLRSNLTDIMSLQWPPYNKTDPFEGALRMLNFATLTPYFGAMK
jgi:uncharacterized protein (DUF1800 family)